MQSWRRMAVVSLFVLGCGDARASCGAAFCSVNTSWNVQGAWSGQGSRLDLRYESVDQDQPMSGRARVAVGQLPRHHDEQSTRNRNLVLSFDHALGPDWGLGLSVPAADREHAHIHNHRGAQLPEAWRFAAVGDARVLLRRRLSGTEGPGPSLSSAGIAFGAKLPTGRRDVRNAEGALAERPLQPGTGTTDALLGAHYAFSLPGDGVSWFAQAMLQFPVNERDGFRPGRRMTADIGVRYEVNDRVAAMLQLNGTWRARDAGLQAEPADTGGHALFASPGLGVAVTGDVQAYGFLQVPVRQAVNGVQLVARRAAVLGLSIRF